jgi:hypothetical protein
VYKHFCVIDGDGFYVTYVLKIDGTVFAYTLKDGERLLDAAPPPSGWDKPRWDGEAWEEGAAE